MFKFFKKKAAKRYLSKEMEQYVQECFLWLNDSVPKYSIKDIQNQLPDMFFEGLMDNLDSKENLCKKVMEKLVKVVEIPKSKISLEFFDTGIESIGSNDYEIFLEDENAKNNLAFSYEDKKKKKFVLGINNSILDSHNLLVSVMIRELSLIKLWTLGVYEIEEPFIDYMVIGYGFGVFNSVESFKYYQNNSSWGFSKLGVLSLNEWSYGLSIFAYLRKDDNIEGVSFLSKDVRDRAERYLAYIYSKPETIDSRIKSISNGKTPR